MLMRKHNKRWLMSMMKTSGSKRDRIPDKKAAIKLLDTLLLVKSGKISFEVVELRPYTGYERIMT